MTNNPDYLADFLAQKYFAKPDGGKYRIEQIASEIFNTFSDKCLEGELRVNTELDYAYHIIEKDHQFLKIGEQFYRKNEIWRDKILKFRSGQVTENELITKNFARVTYTPDNYIEQTEN